VYETLVFLLYLVNWIGRSVPGVGTCCYVLKCLYGLRDGFDLLALARMLLLLMLMLLGREEPWAIKRRSRRLRFNVFLAQSDGQR